MKKLWNDLAILAILNSLKDQNIQEDLVSWPPSNALAGFWPVEEQQK